MTALAALDSFLDSPEADGGVRTMKARQLISEIPGDEDEAFKYFVNIVVQNNEGVDSGEEKSAADDEDKVQAARSYRAMTMLKQDMSMPGIPPVIIKNPEQAGLLAKDLFAGLAVSHRKRYSTLHIRELLDALLEAYPEKVMSAAAAGGKQGIQEHLGPLLSTDQTLTVLTHLVCYGCTGRKGIASAEKSAQHTANMYHQNMGGKFKIGIGQRKKFVRACMDFQLMDKLAKTISTSSAEADLGEESCEAILTMIELIGYPPEELSQQRIQQQSGKEEISVGEEVLLSPLANSDWWSSLLDTLCQSTCTPQQRLAISRTCMQAFSLATGNSSRICKSHAPATDATEQTSEKVVEEKEEKITNRLIEWGLTDKIYGALVQQLPLLVKALDLPDHNILNYQATFPKSGDANVDVPMISHPGRYSTVPFGSWRLQLLSLLKEIVVYNSATNGDVGSGSDPSSSVAIDSLMELPLPPEFIKAKKGEKDNDNGENTADGVVYNPWPALCSYIWAYPNNDFYGIVFFEMLRSVVLKHHEPTLRIILQKSKFLTKATKSVTNPEEQCSSVLLDCLNLLRLRAKSLKPSAFLPQYLNSHDGWKAHVEQVVKLATIQQTLIKSDGKEVDIGLGSAYARKLGLGDIVEYDGSNDPSDPAESSENANQSTQGEAGGKKKKKNNKKKKKKK